MSYDMARGVLVGHVKDTGRGIHKDDIAKLFSRFGKLHRTADVNNEGIGLGLTIIKQIIEQHNGLITVHSAGVSKGSIFCFEMQMALASAHSKASEESVGVVAH